MSRFRVLGVIPARGGSKGVPGKNIRPFLGRPLLAWTVDAARSSGAVDRLIVSTDDERIADIARQCGADVPFIRPSELAQDQTPTAPVIRHALEKLKRDGWSADVVMVLEPTSPARRPMHIRESLELLRNRNADSVASVSAVPHHFVASKQLEIHDDGTMTGIGGVHIRDMIHRRQELPERYAFNGLLYACRSEWLFADPATLWGDTVVGYVTDPKYAIDIDSPEEWHRAEVAMKEILSGEQTR